MSVLIGPMGPIYMSMANRMSFQWYNTHQLLWIDLSDSLAFNSLTIMNKPPLSANKTHLGTNIFFPTMDRQGTQYVEEMKAFERLMFFVRWGGVAVILLMAWLHDPSSVALMYVWAGILGLANIAGYFFNNSIKGWHAQRALSIGMLAADCIVVWGVIFLFAYDFYTSAYASFAIVIIEGAIRFGLTGGLTMAVAFWLGLLAAMIFREISYDVRFSTSGYAFWTGIMSIIALTVGMTTHAGRKHRRESELLLERVTLEQERHRISNELHDSVIKTLEGLALEAQVLQNKDVASSPFVEQKAKYIEEVCHQCSREIRDVIFNVLLSDGEQRNIGSYMAEMLDSWSKDTGIESVFHLSGEDLKLTPEINHHLLRFEAESLSNIRKHAGASYVQVSLQINTDEIGIEVHDDGSGFELNGNNLYRFVAQGKLGITTMKERIEQIGGHFSIQSDHSGTKIYATVPLNVLHPEGDK